jgi:hypothetical protein
MAELSLDEIFEEALKELTAARVAYEDDPRDPGRVARLGAARIELEAARKAMREERRRLGLERDPKIDARVDKADAEARGLWQGMPSD